MVKEQFIYYPDLDWSILKKEHEYVIIDKWASFDLPSFNDIYEAAHHAIDTAKKHIESGEIRFYSVGGPGRTNLTKAQQMICELNPKIRGQVMCACEVSYEDKWVNIYNQIIRECRIKDPFGEEAGLWNVDWRLESDWKKEFMKRIHK